MAAPYYIEVSSTKAKRPKTGKKAEKISAKHYDLFRGIQRQGKPGQPIKSALTEDFKEYMISIYKTPPIVITEEQEERAQKEVESKIIEIAESGACNIQNQEIKVLGRKVLNKVCFFHNDDATLALKHINIKGEYLPDDAGRQNRIISIIEEFLGVVDKYHINCNEIMNGKNFTRELGIEVPHQLLANGDAIITPEGKYAFDYSDHSKITLKYKNEDGSFGEEYTHKYVPEKLATKTLFEIGHGKTIERYNMVSANDQAITTDGIHFKDVILKRVGKESGRLKVVSMTATDEAKQIIHEVIEHIQANNDLIGRDLEAA